ncbi:MAG: T9SS type A sorting domain-containing protein, partial [Saprospiraceae bacterium]
DGVSLFSKDSGDHWTEFGLPYIKTPFDNIVSMVNYHDSLLIAGLDANFNVSFAISKDLVSWTPFKIQNKDVLTKNQFNMVSVGDMLLFNVYNFESIFYKYSQSKQSLSICKGIDLDYSFGNNSKLIKFGDKNYLLNCIGGKFISEDDGENWYLFIDQFYVENNNLFTDALLIDSSIYFASNYVGLLEFPIKEIKGSKINTNVFYDSNLNLVRDNQDKGLKGTFLKLKENGNYIVSNSNGEADLFYSIAYPDTFEVIHHFKYGNFIPASVPIDGNLKAYNFAYQIPSGINDVSIQMYAGRRARPGFDFSLYLVIQNNGSVNWAGILNLQYDKIFQFLNCSDILSKQSLGFLSWDIDTLSTLETKMIQVNFNLPANTPLGTIYTHIAEVSNNLISDNDLTDNTAKLSYKVVASCDPNEIEVDKNVISKKEFSDGTNLNYKIRFQNTGNSPAEFVTIKINIDNLDPESIHFISSSHEYEYSIDVSGYYLTVRFDMIQLVDSSSNESMSHGFIHFTAIPRKSLTYLKQIDCSASIYFDYNPYVQTNIATTLIKEVTLTKESALLEPKIQVFPNPNDGSFFVKTTETFSFRALSIYDITGKIVFIKKFDETISACNIKLSNLVPGTYSIKLEGDIIQFAKFVVLE